jgi:2,4-dienoyl-CoA reductase (NADPH2)
MARPFLADPAFVNKVRDGQSDLINICIACNQACLDHYFTGQVISCLVNPRAAREASFSDEPASSVKRVAVIGGGVAGISAALEAGRRGHDVTLYEASGDVGGQFDLAARVPGKEDYARVIKSFRRQLDESGVLVKTGHRIQFAELERENFDEVIVSTGVTPRSLDIPGADDPRVVGYTSILDGSVTAGERVVIVGAGGIGHDIALTLALGEEHGEQTIKDFENRWGLLGTPALPKARRSVTMLKRSSGRFGATLGKSTGWILRQELKDLGVRQISEVKYIKIDADGFHIEVNGRAEVLPMDTVVVCAGQISNRQLADDLEERGQSVRVIGGAKLAGELDAKRAIYEGAVIGNSI